jgi:hypothetical protein
VWEQVRKPAPWEKENREAGEQESKGENISSTLSVPVSSLKEVM